MVAVRVLRRSGVYHCCFGVLRLLEYRTSRSVNLFFLRGGLEVHGVTVTPSHTHLRDRPPRALYSAHYFMRTHRARRACLFGDMVTLSQETFPVLLVPG